MLVALLAYSIIEIFKLEQIIANGNDDVSGAEFVVFPFIATRNRILY